MKRTVTTIHDETKTSLFQVEIVREDDGRWSAGVPALPGCATWGYTKGEALANIQDAVIAYIRDLRKAGEEIPPDATIRIVSETVVAVKV
jgi:antitoxin HicB